jgi:hypothetical protein
VASKRCHLLNVDIINSIQAISPFTDDFLTKASMRTWVLGEEPVAMLERRENRVVLTKQIINNVYE